MRVLLQKVTAASVTIDHETVGAIAGGYLLFVGVLHGDTAGDASWLAEKITKLRLFPGEDATVNDRSILDVRGEILIISQFTLAGRTEKGNRPDYTKAMPPAAAEELYNVFVQEMRHRVSSRVETGRFGAMMQVHLINDGPVTLLLEHASSSFIP